ncbi:nuclear receptor coactivator 7 isoform X2 [Protopterus annectens]|uniref:nuclear receptor coactivator 7 isoform X2 n=1 Tax=Protopterus annectens TaxID=7888 RepID=UPI001CF93B1D|nr:nuclear receptor coactivator 7 isoform X2 [Protopterus annectens]
MLITPNNIMFDPHKSDPLVIENGCEEYGLICPMEEIVSIALYSDISHMKLKDVLPSPQDWADLSSDKDLSPFNKFKAMSKEKCQNNARVCDIPLECKTTELPTIVDGVCSDTAVGKESQAGVPVYIKGPTELQPVILSEKLSTTSESVEMTGKTSRAEDMAIIDLTTLVSSLSVGDREKCYGEASPNTETVTTPSTVCEGKNVTVSLNGNKWHTNMLKVSLTHPSNETCCSMENITQLLQDCRPEMGPTLVSQVNDVPLPDNELEVFNNRKFEICSSEVMDRSQSAGTVLVSLEVPEVVVSDESSPQTSSPEELQSQEIDSESEVKMWLLQKIQGPIEDIIPSKDETSKNPPMFLCLRVGKPMRKSFAVQSTFMTPQYSRKGSQSEYWFAVPQERVDQLYAFFVHWSPEVYGKEAKDQGFVVVEKDELDMIDNFFSAPTAKSWEIITVEEARRRKSICSIYDEDGDDLIFPSLTDVSVILGNHHIEKLIQHLPARTQGYAWKLMYSTSVHGTSLKTLYRNLACFDSPVLLVIKDMDDQVFGALASHPFRISDHYYGTGETFLFTFNPDFKIFRWSEENSYFIKGDVDFLELGGGGSGYFGLWVDADLYYGRSNPCSTFNNEMLSSTEDFTVQDLEVWTFM